MLYNFEELLRKPRLITLTYYLTDSMDVKIASILFNLMACKYNNMYFVIYHLMKLKYYHSNNWLSSDSFGSGCIT